MKPELRKQLLQRRARLDTERIGEAAVAALADFLRQRGAGRVMLYLPFRGELSPLGLLRLHPEARYFLPRTTAEGLSVHPFDAPRERHRYGFAQPAAGAPEVDPATLDAVVVPGLAFDRAGGRLGYGAGYYDRFLATLPPRVLRIGLVPEALVLEALPRDPWDVPVDFLATERGVRPARRDHDPDKMAP
ncbi:5-formyltetrahydrofolate cyclo-ligase [Oceanithermus profundus]